MARRGEGNGYTLVGELLLNDPEELRRVIVATLEQWGGRSGKTAEALGISRPFFHHCLRRLNMRRAPALERDRWRRRWGLDRDAACTDRRKA